MDIIEEKFPEILTFSEEVIHVDRASRVSMDGIQKTLKQMDNSIRNLETDLKNAKTIASENDKFLEVMGVSFPNQRINLKLNTFIYLTIISTTLLHFMAIHYVVIFYYIIINIYDVFYPYFTLAIKYDRYF